MALPESFQVALQRAQDERKLERESVLQRVGETVRMGVPYLSGVVAGALANSPIVGIGTAFIADQLQARAEQKREERRAQREETRYREEAARIAVREGLYQDEAEALQAIEANRLQQELENSKAREEELLQRFNLNREQEELVQEQQESTPVVEEQQESTPIVRDEGEATQTGLALESTLESVDSNISGITDLLLDRFADEENRLAREQDKRELEAARLRETLSENSRQQVEVVKEEVGEPERERRGGLFGGVGSLLGRVPLPILIAGAAATIVAGLGAVFREELTLLGTEVDKAVRGRAEVGTEAEQRQAREEAEQVGDPLSLSETVAEETARAVAEPERVPVTQAPQTIDEFGNIERDVAQSPEREYSWFDGLLGGLVDAINRLATAIGVSYRQTRLQSVQQRIDFLASEAGQLQESDPNRVRLIDEMDQLKQERDRLQSELEQSQLPESASLQRPTALTGTAMAKVSFDQSSKQPAMIASVDNSSTASTTNINASKTVNAFSTNARNNEMRGKYTYA